MSYVYRRWAQTQFNPHNLRTIERLVLFFLAHKANTSGLTEPLALPEVAKSCSLSIRSVRRMIEQLKKEGLVEVQPVYDEFGGQRGNRYQLPAVSGKKVN